MTMKICPFCREKIQRLAVVCRFCRRDLPAVPKPRKRSSGALALITASAVIVSTTVIMAVEFLRERNNWRN